MSKLPRALQNLSIPVIGSPLFIISNPQLVIEQCKAGIIGSMPALNARPAAQLDEWLHEITEDARRVQQGQPGQAGCAVRHHQIVHKSNDRLEHDMEMVVKYKVPVIITLAGRPHRRQRRDPQLRRRGAARHH
jgi:nitronate monooxygenase